MPGHRTAGQLRYGAARGRKVLLVWDKACINYHLWYTLRHTHGIYFLTLEKANSATGICSPDQLDHTEPKNSGNSDMMKMVEIARNFINTAVTGATQRTQRFIRWVRVRICQQVPWSESVARLRELWILQT